MAAFQRFAVSLANINRYFVDAQRRVFTSADLAFVLQEKRDLWNLPISMNTDRFISQLIDKSGFREVLLQFDGMAQKKLYTLGEVSAMELACYSFNKAYLSHYSAVSIHQLTEQIPKTVYVTVEQSKKPLSPNYSLSQESIDAAFSKPQRLSSTRASYLGEEIILLKGKHTGNLGVRSQTGNRQLRLTDTERTLIDSTVRPSYSGGVFEVLKAYSTAAENKNISINRLSAYLTKLDFIYPYHQAVGFYLQHCGAYSLSKLDLLRQRGNAIYFLSRLRYAGNRILFRMEPFLPKRYDLIEYAFKPV